MKSNCIVAPQNVTTCIFLKKVFSYKKAYLLCKNLCSFYAEGDTELHLNLQS